MGRAKSKSAVKSQGSAPSAKPVTAKPVVKSARKFTLQNSPSEELRVGVKLPKAFAPRSRRAGGEPEPLRVKLPSAEDVRREAQKLSPPDRTAFHRLMELLASGLGSEEAARVWLVAPSAEFRSTPLAEVRGGHAAALLELVESRYGPSPAYG
jgi:hypothetical protein